MLIAVKWITVEYLQSKLQLMPYVKYSNVQYFLQ